MMDLELRKIELQIKELEIKVRRLQRANALTSLAQHPEALRDVVVRGLTRIMMSESSRIRQRTLDGYIEMISRYNIQSSRLFSIAAAIENYDSSDDEAYFKLTDMLLSVCGGI